MHYSLVLFWMCIMNSIQTGLIGLGFLKFIRSPSSIALMYKDSLIICLSVYVIIQICYLYIHICMQILIFKWIDWWHPTTMWIRQADNDKEHVMFLRKWHCCIASTCFEIYCNESAYQICALYNQNWKNK